MIRGRLEEVRERMRQAAERAGRDPREIRLVAVSKTQPAEVIEAGLAAGLTLIGENRVQEVEEKFPRLNLPEGAFHFIGHLQSNKVKKLMDHCPVLIHSVDSVKIARKIAQYAPPEGQPVLLEVNTSGEESKFGLAPERVETVAQEISGIEGIRLMGLMTIGALTEDRERIRGCFHLLRELRDHVRALGLPGVRMDELSMGMTHDFQIAIEEGSTIVRIGTGVFGPRRPRQ